ncbi:MAG TPA: 4-hydroxy-tetrahydrodipicolinate reductase [Polyangia bacterium]
MAETVRIAVFGAAGKMGGLIVRAIAETPGAALVAAIERPDFPELGSDASRWAGLPESGVCFQAERPGAGVADVWIDFSARNVAVANAAAGAQAGAAMVTGTTGLSDQEKREIAVGAKQVPMVVTPNMSMGVSVLLRLVADAARALGPGYDIEIVETHHRMKRDAPSGTALRLAEAVAEATGRDLGKTARYDRHGDIGPRTHEEIGIQTLRGGDVVGDHTVFFLGQGDRIEITHRASSRETFARGAVRAALWVRDRDPGLYDMRDVLGLR